MAVSVAICTVAHKAFHSPVLAARQEVVRPATNWAARVVEAHLGVVAIYPALLALPRFGEVLLDSHPLKSHCHVRREGFRVKGDFGKS